MSLYFYILHQDAQMALLYYFSIVLRPHPLFSTNVACIRIQAKSSCQSHPIRQCKIQKYGNQLNRAKTTCALETEARQSVRQTNKALSVR